MTVQTPHAFTDTIFEQQKKKSYNIYIYICIYIYIYACVCLCLCVCVYIYTCVYVHVRAWFFFRSSSGDGPCFPVKDEGTSGPANTRAVNCCPRERVELYRCSRWYWWHEIRVKWRHSRWIIVERRGVAIITILCTNCNNYIYIIINFVIGNTEAIHC